MSYPGLGVGCVLPKAVREALGIKEEKFIVRYFISP
jgi:bifunctional DNA-binding transcriptional regulator/antitoxin component of YhaV-PrlF toxin-antitoxin module